MIRSEMSCPVLYIVCLLLCLLLSACGKAQALSPTTESKSPKLSVSSVVADPWKDASPETSALLLGYKDGGKSKAAWMFDQQAEKELLKELSKTPAYPVEGWTADLVTEPIYSLYTGSKSGGPLSAAWSNGYFIMQDGKVYRCDIDLSFIREKVDGSDHPQDGFAISNLRYLSQKDGQWIPERMIPATELSSPSENITVSLKEEYADGQITVLYQNSGSSDWTYGEPFCLQVCLNGIWYNVPEMPDRHYGFTLVGYSLPAGESAAKTYSLNGHYRNPDLPSGDLPAGDYRMVFSGLKEALSVEFKIPSGPSSAKESSAEVTLPPASESDPAVDLWENAREESLMIGWWENGEGEGNHLFHDKAREVVDRLKQFAAWPADNWTVDLVAGPIYSVFCYNQEGGPLAGAWSNGYFIMQDGKVYRCDADLSFIRDLLADPSLNPDIAVNNIITNRRYLSQKNGEWIRERLYPADELSASSGSISASLAEPYEDGRVTVLLKNNSSEDVLYGEMFRLQVCLDGSWYSVPSMPDANYSFTDIGYSLSSGQSTEKEYSLNRMFINPELPAGELPAGTYRLVFREEADKNYSVEFEVPKTVRIWEKASETAMITAGLYENGTVRTAGLFDAEKQTVLEKLCRISAAPAEDWTSDLVTEPVYTLLAWDYATGKPVSGLWSNGYFIMQDGKVYRCSEDLSFLRDLISDPAAGEGIQPDYYLSNWRYISQKDGRWIRDRLIPAQETPAPPEGILAEMVRDYANGQLTVRFKNQRDSEWAFGYGYSLQVRLDGNWYLVPQMSDLEYLFPAVARILPAGDFCEHTYSFKTMYLNPDLPSGDLPAGTYRIRIGDVQPLFIEFEIP